MTIAKKNQGFTLIELMVVVVIIGIIAMIAFPAYQDNIKRTKRADAKVALLALQQAQEKYRANCPIYASGIGTTRTCVAGSATAGDHNLVGVATSEHGYYTLAISNTSATTYTLTATKAGVQAVDTDCATFTLDQNGTKTSSPTANCW